MTPQKAPKIIIISSNPNIFIFLTPPPPPPPPPHKNEIQNFETPKMDRTYLYKIILEYNPSPPTTTTPLEMLPEI